ncbi:acyl-CoA carboxylase subunit epsilon [Streptomyces sp. NBC_01089]|uniref:acyl-CoA carboxylase subunit epsilon n=1 Tax=Streptomyces sp. NBC_01089 TaxID=2903747 RepID=UPI00386AB0D3|nr:acyl-CoA carboxylase subunit epsilon [Streptomyces sp. NBC_01089]
MIKVVRGNPTAEELAAMVAVLSADRTAGPTGGPAPGPRPAGAWGSPPLLLRTPHTYGPAGWRTPALPH